MGDTDQGLMEQVRAGHLRAYEKLYKKYYNYLIEVAYHIVKNENDSEEIVSDVFVKIWKNRQEIIITTSLKAYLIRAVHNSSLNYLEKVRTKNSLFDDYSLEDLKILAWDSDYPLGQLYEKDISKILNKCIEQLPEGCRKAFILSRGRNLTYHDIAREMGISVNTVKMQIKIALSRLRLALRDYLGVVLVFFSVGRFQ